MEYVVTDSHIEETLAKVKKKIPYIDRVTIWLDTSAHMIDLSGIKEFCGGEVFERHTPMRKNPKWKCKIDLFQPSREAFILIKNQLCASYLINYFEPSLDYITDTHANAKAIQEFFEGTLIKKWHKNKHIKKYDTGVYFGPRKTASNFVSYCGKPSKMNDKPCCHIEMRFHGSPTVRRAGIDCLDALIKFDPYRFWKKYLNLRRLEDMKKLGSAIVREYPKSYKYKRPIRKMAAILFLRGYAQVGDEYDSVISAQGIIDNGKSFNGRRYLLVIPNAPFLPSNIICKRMNKILLSH